VFRRGLRGGGPVAKEKTCCSQVEGNLTMIRQQAALAADLRKSATKVLNGRHC
jgi:hypothetical protein